MDRFFARESVPQRVPEPPEKTRDLLTDIRDLLQKLVGSGGGARAWDQYYLDLVANIPQRIPVHQGRKSLSLYCSASGPTGSGNAYLAEGPVNLTSKTGMPILSGAEREFEHEAEMWVVSDTGCRVIVSEEWEP